MNHYYLPHQTDAYHHRRCAVEKYSENSTSESFSTIIRNIHYTICLKSCFEKDEHTPSRKLNKHFESHFHHLEKNPCMVSNKKTQLSIIHLKSWQYKYQNQVKWCLLHYLIMILIPFFTSNEVYEEYPAQVYGLSTDSQQ